MYFVELSEAMELLLSAGAAVNQERLNTKVVEVDLTFLKSKP